jgi:hypothetical protein
MRLPEKVTLSSIHNYHRKMQRRHSLQHTVNELDIHQSKLRRSEVSKAN